MQPVTNRNNIYFNCCLLLELANISTTETTTEDLNTLFSLNTPCHYCKTSRKDNQMEGGICSENHYIPLYKLVNNLTKFLKLSDNYNNKDFLDILLQNLNMFKEPKSVLDIAKCYLLADFWQSGGRNE